MPPLCAPARVCAFAVSLDTDCLGLAVPLDQWFDKRCAYRRWVHRAQVFLEYAAYPQTDCSAKPRLIRLMAGLSVLADVPATDPAGLLWARALYAVYSDNSADLKQALSGLVYGVTTDMFSPSVCIACTCSRRSIVRALLAFPWNRLLAAPSPGNCLPPLVCGVDIKVLEYYGALCRDPQLARQIPPWAVFEWTGLAPTNPRLFWDAIPDTLWACRCHFSSPGMANAMRAMHRCDMARLLFTATPPDSKFAAVASVRDSLGAWLTEGLPPPLLDAFRLDTLQKDTGEDHRKFVNALQCAHWLTPD